MSESSLVESTLRKFRKTAYEFKLQVAEANAKGEPLLLWVRIGVHPQRCLCVGQDGRVRVEQWLSPSAPEPQWRVHYVEALEQPDVGTPLPAACLLQNAKTGKFLSVRDGRPVLQTEGDVWGIARLRNAMTPGRALRAGVLAGGGGVAVASVGAVGVAGAAAVGAVVRGAGAVSAAGTAVSGAAAAASGVASAASALTVAKAAAAIASVPGAIATVAAAATGVSAAVATMGTTIYYGAVGAGCGVAIGLGGAATAAVAVVVDHARDPGLYIRGYPFVPEPLMRSISKLSVRSEESGLGRSVSEVPSESD